MLKQKSATQRYLQTILIATFSLIVIQNTANAQNRSGYDNRRGFFRYNTYRSQHQSIFNRPTVSPYLSLLSQDGRGGLPTYFTRVKPMLEAREGHDRQQNQISRMQQQITSVQQAVAPQRRDGVAITGHPTRFMNMIHYYPSLSRR